MSLNNFGPNKPIHTVLFNDAVATELAFIFDEIFEGDSKKMEEMISIFKTSVKHIDKHWQVNSKPAVKPKLSTYGYRIYKLHSSAQLAKTPNEPPDFRVVFKYVEATNTIEILTVGIRVDKYNNNYLPTTHDIYERTKILSLPEEE